MPSKDASKPKKSRGGSGSKSSALSGHLIGRTAELDRLKDALHRTKDRNGCVVLEHGEAGIGKTRLAEELADYAESVDCSAAWGRSSEERGAPPYWPWAQILEKILEIEGPRWANTPGMDLLTVAFPSLPGGRRKDAMTIEVAPTIEAEMRDEARFRLFDVVRRLIVREARRRPLLLILDDLHWADEPSLLLLTHIAGETRSAPIMLLGTYRDGDAGEALKETVASLARIRRFASSPVRGLSVAESRELMESVSGRNVPEDLAEAVFRLTEGNPLHLRQVAFSVPDGRLEQIDAADLAGGVREAVIHRLGRLSSPARTLLSAAAVLGTDFAPAILRRVVPETHPGSMAGLLEEACAKHFIRDSPEGSGGFVFVHSLIREAVLAATGQLEKVRLHARIASVLEETYGIGESLHAAELLRHFQASQAVHGIAPVARYALLAGERALASHAYEEAIAHFDAGLHVLEGHPSDETAGALFFGIAKTRGLLSLGRDALPYFVRCFEHYERAGDRAGMLRVLTCGSLPGELALLPLYDRLLPLVEEGSLDEARLRVYSEAFRSIGDVLYFDERLLRRLLATAHKYGDALLEMRALLFSNYVAGIVGSLRSTEALDRLVRAREIARALGDEYHEMVIFPQIVSFLLHLGRSREAAREAELARKVAERSEDRLAQVLAARALREVAVHDSRWDEAVELSNRILEIAPPSQQQSGGDLAARIWVRYQMGDVVQGAADIDILVERIQKIPRVPAIIFLVCADAIVETAYITDERRHLDIAEATARMALSLPQSTPSYRTSARRILAMIAVLESDTAEAEVGRRHLVGVLQKAPDEERPLSSYHRELGLLARTVGALDEAVSHLENALARPGSSASVRAWYRHELALTLRQRGGPGDKERAAVCWRQALEESVRLGINLLEGKVRKEVEAASVGAADEAVSANPDGLSSREIEVLRLVVRGFTNREIGQKLFISTKTVDTHLSNILSKTGMANRTEAAAYAIRNGLAEG